MEENKVFNIDCMIGMSSYPNDYFDIAIVDPPYNFSCSKTAYISKNKKFSDRFQRHGCGLKDKGSFVVGQNHKDSLKNPPDEKYFAELFRVSKNQIIWGGQTFANFLPNSMEWIFWDKMTGGSYFSDGELAWTSFGGAVRMYRRKNTPNKNSEYLEQKIHPTQKPIKLYEWILNKYAKAGDFILDTHVGSGSSRIACAKGGFNFIGFEIDKGYWEAQEKRFHEYKKQLRLF